MAHSCPDCSLRCHCGGDIDDIEFENSKYEATCDHCDGDDDPEDADDDSYLYDGEAA